MSPDPLAAMTGLLLSAAQTKDRLAATGLSPVFDQQTPQVKPFDTTKMNEGVLSLIRDIEFFAHHNTHQKLAGLAANQLQKDGQRLDLRLCCVMFNGQRRLQAALNPVIVEKFGPTYRSKEGCLTWPGKLVVALRSTGVEVKYTDVMGGWMQDDKTLTAPMQEVTRRVEGTAAVIWQHEVDHLDGVIEEFMLQLTKDQRPGPNEPCVCKSGRKWKRCCGR